MKNWATFISTVASHIVPKDDAVVESSQPGLIEAVEEAHRDWLAARAHFENVSDPELVDHAIYLMEAAQRRYMYVLKLAQEEKMAKFSPPIE